MLEHDVHSPPFSEPPHLLGNVLAVVIDTLMRTELAGAGQLLCRAGGDDDQRPMGVRDLGRLLPDTATGR